MHKGGPCSNSSCAPTSFSQRNKEIRRNARAGQRTQSSTQGISGTGSTFSWFQEVLWLLFDTSPGEPTTMKRGKKSCGSSRETENNDHKERKEGLLLSQGAEKRLAKPNTQSSLLPPTPLLQLKPGQKPPCLSLKGEERQWGEQAEICLACPSSIPAWAKF